MSAQPIHPEDAFMAWARYVGFHSSDHGSYACYERLKGEYQRRFPEHDSRDYERVTLKLQRIAGV